MAPRLGSIAVRPTHLIVSMENPQRFSLRFYLAQFKQYPNFIFHDPWLPISIAILPQRQNAELGRN
jgi:hypothetical protein